MLNLQILRANLDGSNVTIIIPDSKVTAITLNRKDKKILWVDEKNGIACSDYEGNNLAILTESPVSIKSLTFFENQLFWLLPAYMDRNASLWSCKLIDGTCKDYKNHTVSLHNPFSIKIYSELDSMELQDQNPCKVNNGNCSDFCLLIPGSRRSCACKVGYQLNLDYQFCRHTTEFMIYVENQYIRGAILNPKQKAAFVDAIIPTPFSIEPSDSVIDFEYDLLNDNFYFTDGKAVYMTSIIKDGEQKTIVTIKKAYRIVDLAFDWLSSNLYYSMDSITDGFENRIVAVTQDFKNNFIQKTIDIGNDSYQCPHSLFVEAKKGYLFFSRCDSVYYENFHRKDMDGSKIQNLHQFGQKKELEIFALDHDEDRIYYFDSSKQFIYHADFNFKNIESNGLYISIENINSIYVYKENIYLGNSFSVWRLDKSTGSDKTKILPKFENNSVKKISGIKVVSVATHTSNLENKCAKNNGGCDQFCFSRSSQLCGCEDSKQLQTNGRCV